MSRVQTDLQRVGAKTSGVELPPRLDAGAGAPGGQHHGEDGFTYAPM